jgi:hypothetical protein
MSCKVRATKRRSFHHEETWFVGILFGLLNARRAGGHRDCRRSLTDQPGIP